MRLFSAVAIASTLSVAFATEVRSWAGRQGGRQARRVHGRRLIEKSGRPYPYNPSNPNP